MTPEKIIKARKNAGLTQTEAAALVWVSLRTWQNWEAGAFDIKHAAWELFLIKINKDAKND